MALTRRKKIVFALAAMALSLAGTIVLLLAADLVLHYRAERSAGLNRYGYRGPVVPRKQTGELRVAVLGGSTVFGYGVGWNESIPAFLEARLRERLTRTVRVLNLGFNNEGAFAFLPNLEDFAYLDYDVVVLYEGYNDLQGDERANRAVYRRDSAIYRMVGYYPILPLYLDEKAMALRLGNNLNAAYDEARRRNEGVSADSGQVVFRPGLAQRASAATLEAVASMTQALDGQLQRTPDAPPPALKESESLWGCTFPYASYCDSIVRAARYALARGSGVVVASQPRIPGTGGAHVMHARQQNMIGDMLRREFGGEARVKWADLANLLDLSNPDSTFDGMHLKPGGNAAVAAALTDPVLAVAPAAHR